MKIQSYGRRELATLYSPYITPNESWRKFKSWIEGNKLLSDELEKAGYSRTSRVFTPLQVGIIFRYLGEP
jgi:hypothetical protein